MLFRQEAGAVTVFAPAKLNLFLNVLGKRPDGYHDLETLMVAIGVWDTLRFVDVEGGGTALHCHDGRPAPQAQPLQLSSDPSNLVIKAIEALRRKTGIDRGVRVDLVKRIPLAAGLAGGSSDAAATLVGLNWLWRLGLDQNTLHDLAAGLGSDVPFFLSPTGAAICRGRGELVEPVRLPRLSFVIVRPGSGLSTAEVFRHSRTGDAPFGARSLVDALHTGDLARAAGKLWNSLQRPAEGLCPDVGALARRFSRLPVLGHLMTGSGTSYFGMCFNRPHAAMVAARLRAVRAGQVFVAHSSA